MSNEEGPEIPRRLERKLRRCMTCQQDFLSEHKFNRICVDCKDDIRKNNHDYTIFGENPKVPSDWSLLG